MRPSTAVLVYASTGCDAASGSNPVVCPSFDAQLMLFDSVAGAFPGSMNLRQISAQPTFKVFNYDTESPVEADKIYAAIQLSDRMFVRLAGGGVGGTLIQFQITRVGDYPDATPGDYDNDECANKPAGAPDGTVYATIRRLPCGGTPDGETEIALTDEHGFFTRRKEHELIGKIGVAAKMSPTAAEIDEAAENDQPPPPCIYLVIWIDWFRVRETVTDVYWQDPDIIVEKERHWVWDHCLLPDENIRFVDCAGES